MADSILDSVKKVIGLAPDYDTFDEDIIMQINSAFMTLCQLGVGSTTPFTIYDKNEVWDDFPIVGNLPASVKPYIVLKVRMAFDPPATSHALTATKEQILEHEWRLNVSEDHPVLVEATDNL